MEKPTTIKKYYIIPKYEIRYLEKISLATKYNTVKILCKKLNTHEENYICRELKCMKSVQNIKYQRILLSH